MTALLNIFKILSSVNLYGHTYILFFKYLGISANSPPVSA